MIECDPPASVEVVNTAAPLLIVLVPKTALPSVKVTIPVADDGVMVAVSVTNEPYAEGLIRLAIATVEFTLFTDCRRAVEVHPVSAIEARRGTIRNTGRSIIHSRRILGFLRRCNLSAGHKSPVFGTTLPMPTIKNLIERQPCAPGDRLATAS